uniref:Cystatin domain-containing protein n=1 Tax=Ailuropoda melanoleuca TaxID=9646 RepID=A0A7N5KP83_AILME
MGALRWLLVCSIILLSCRGKQGLQVRMVGAPVSASIDEDDVRRALRFAMNEYNRASNDKYVGRVSEVVEAQKQIVAGVKYYLEVKVGRTTCAKSVTDVTAVENCAFHEAPALAKTVTCHFVNAYVYMKQIN